MKKLLIIVLMFCSIAIQAQKTATVIRIVDGDTFVAVLLKSKDTVKIRVRYIDCPEGKSGAISKEQVYYQEAKKQATNILLGKTVKLYYANIKSYGRDIARVWVNGYYYDRYMILNGYAWAYPQQGLWLRLQKGTAEERQDGLFKKSLYGLGNELMTPENWRRTYTTKK